MPTPYIPYKKEEPVAIHPLQKNQNSLDVINKGKGNSENYFYPLTIDHFDFSKVQMNILQIYVL